jgi:hypothetical protein
VTIKKVARLYGAAFMKAASVETAVNGFMTSEILLGSSHLIQTFFSNRIFQPWETEDCSLAEVTPHPTHMTARGVCDHADFSPYKNSGVS